MPAWRELWGPYRIGKLPLYSRKVGGSNLPPLRHRTVQERGRCQQQEYAALIKLTRSLALIDEDGEPAGAWRTEPKDRLSLRKASPDSYLIKGSAGALRGEGRRKGELAFRCFRVR